MVTHRSSCVFDEKNRRSNNQRTFPARAPSAGDIMRGSSLQSTGGGGTWAGFGGYPTAGVVCPTVDGRAEAAEQDLFSPGVGLAVSFVIGVTRFTVVGTPFFLRTAIPHPKS